MQRLGSAAQDDVDAADNERQLPILEPAYALYKSAPITASPNRLRA